VQKSKGLGDEFDNQDYDSSPLVKHVKHMQRLQRSATMRESGSPIRTQDSLSKESGKASSKGNSPFALKRQKSITRSKGAGAGIFASRKKGTITMHDAK